MLWLICGLCLALALFFGWLAGKTKNDDWGGIAVLFTMVATCLVVFVPTISIANSNGLAKWQAFYTANTQNYEIAVDETASYLSQDEFAKNTLIDGSIERFSQAGFVSERIKEWRDAVNEYNTTIASMQYFNRNVFTGVLVPNEVEDMRLLIIK